MICSFLFVSISIYNNHCWIPSAPTSIEAVATIDAVPGHTADTRRQLGNGSIILQMKLKAWAFLFKRRSCGSSKRGKIAFHYRNENIGGGRVIFSNLIWLWVWMGLDVHVEWTNRLNSEWTIKYLISISVHFEFDLKTISPLIRFPYLFSYFNAVLMVMKKDRKINMKKWRSHDPKW